MSVLEDIRHLRREPKDLASPALRENHGHTRVHTTPLELVLVLLLFGLCCLLVLCDAGSTNGVTIFRLLCID